MSEVITPLHDEPKLDWKSPDLADSNNNDQIRDLGIEPDIDLNNKLESYAIALAELQANSPAPHEVILQVLLTRDSLQKAIDSQEERSVESLIKLSGLDNQLRSQDQAIATGLHLSLWRNILHPPATNWWWFFEAIQPIPKQKGLDRFDWVFNLFTALFLTGMVSFGSKIIPLIFSNGISLFESVGIVGPSGMIAVVLSSMQGGAGQKKLQDGMAKLGIPAQYQSEVTFLISFLLFAAGYFAQENLPQYYFKNYRIAGDKAYSKGQMREARDNYEQALKIDGQDPVLVAKLHTSLGLLDESVGNQSGALKSYHLSLDMGDIKVLNNIGRLKISEGKLDAAETFLTMGLQRIEPTDINTQYQLYRNLGWVNLEKKRYDKSLEYLEQAIEFDKQIAKGNFGKGIANCFKAKIYELQEKRDKAANQWNLCAEFGKPETFQEYETILKLNPEIGVKLDTTGIFN